MAMNMIKRLERIKTYLKSKNLDISRPFDEDIFIHAVMLVEGMTRKKALEWMYCFADVGLIKYKAYKVSFIGSSD